jgi:hypothetical protein
MKELAGLLPFLAFFRAYVPLGKRLMDTAMKAGSLRRIPFNQQLHVVSWMRHVVLPATQTKTISFGLEADISSVPAA